MVPVCWARIKPEELFEVGYNADFKWYPLKGSLVHPTRDNQFTSVVRTEDKVIDKLKENVYPGSVLLRLGTTPTES